ncbi:epoxide hydrolase family protein [Methylobacterium indicum]|uniref:Epoxide hydrolase N-terminal domain-containing protein n=1 Tax=Methylobacterium indicum TaxID=1775910 RepID=A0A8H8WTB9_9HYPH|nr:epoxide hydrolase [Methylobacterium indicum]BCM83959.1 hypothetical protein mvi_24200 [Methylobacterium indicum]
MTAEPFTTHVPDAALADLRERLARTRLPDQAPEAPWTYGTDVTYLADLIAYWRDGFDWRAQEAALNAFPQIIHRIGEIDLHCLHVPGQGPDPRPLLLCHGWPGSVFEFLDLIPRLTDPARFGGRPEDAFTVVAPSLPGYGLSFRPGQPRLGVEEIADHFSELMTRLGYARFMAQGGDWGAFITTRLAWRYPERVEGLHLNMLPVRRDLSGRDATPEEAAHYERVGAWLKEETGYQWIQGTKPQTLAFALTDSPAGLAAWIAKKIPVLVGLRRHDRDGDSPRPDARQYLALLVHRRDRLVVPPLLFPDAPALAGAGRGEGAGADGLRGVPEGDGPPAPLAGRANDVRGSSPLDRDAARRALRRPRAAGPPRGGCQGLRGLAAAIGLERRACRPISDRREGGWGRPLPSPRRNGSDPRIGVVLTGEPAPLRQPLTDGAPSKRPAPRDYLKEDEARARATRRCFLFLGRLRSGFDRIGSLTSSYEKEKRGRRRPCGSDLRVWSRVG